MAVIGYKAGMEQFQPQELVEFAAAAEEAGFESIDASDHFAPWSEAGQAPFVWTWLGSVAAKTSRIELGTGVTCPILRYHPAIIAQAAATLECLAPGRTYLGVGTGEALNEYASTGDWPDYSERQERLAEAIELIRHLWSGEEVTFEGEYWETRKARTWSRPERQIPIYVSSLVPGSARFAGYHGDGLFTVGGQPPEQYKELLKEFDAGAREAGKDPSSLPKLIELNVALTEDDEASIDVLLKYWAGTFVPALFNRKIYTPKESAQNGEAVGPDTVRRKACISADPETHAQYIQQHVDLGFTHLFIHNADMDQLGFIKRYGREVLPLVRQQAVAA